MRTETEASLRYKRWTSPPVLLLKVSGGARRKTTFSSDRDGNKAALRVLVINLIGGKILSNATNSIPERAPTMLMSWSSNFNVLDLPRKTEAKHAEFRRAS